MQTSLDSVPSHISIIEQAYTDIKTTLSETILGQDRVIELLCVSVFSGSHSILEGIPGLAKTLMIKQLSSLLGLDFKRIQFTPDLMPSDVTGSEILQIDPEDGKRYFKFIKGPIFANIVLADEINRTPPKTQAALLQAMQEYQVTIGGKTYQLEPPFIVLATQNPIEQEGTYPLPEAQLDRFMFCIKIDYPDRETEKQIVVDPVRFEKTPGHTVLNRHELLHIKESIHRIPVSDSFVEKVIDLIRASRPESENAHDIAKRYLKLGASPRAGQFLITAARTISALRGKISPDLKDLEDVSIPVLRHRLIPNYNAYTDGYTTDQIISEIVSTVLKI